MLTLLSACIDESGKIDCAQGFTLSFYSKTPCQADTVYVGSTSSLRLYIFNEDDVLAEYYERNNVNLSKGYTEEIEIAGGKYTVIAWTGVDAPHYDISDVTRGVTRKDDLLFRIKRIDDVATAIDGTEVYTGESITIEVPDNPVPKAELAHAGVNLFEVTNRLDIEIEGLSNVEDYEIRIETDNGSMNVDGTLSDDDMLIYRPVNNSTSELLKVDFTLLKLKRESNYVIVLKNIVTGKELYRESMVYDLMQRNPSTNFTCDHDFSFHFKVDDLYDYNTFVMLEIWVNDWLVYSYDTEL